jgi:hypothetical protein
MRQFALTNENLTKKIQQLEIKYDRKFENVFQAIDYLLRKDNQETKQKQRKQIGYL